MPIVDMPVRELEAYMGSSPRPRDFDEYWARALAALDAQNLQVEFVPAAFQAPGALTSTSRAWAARACTPSS